MKTQSKTKLSILINSFYPKLNLIRLVNIFIVALFLDVSCNKDEDHEVTSRLLKSTTSLSSSDYEIVFQKEVFMRQTGKPYVISRTIGNSHLNDFEDCFIIHVQTGLNNGHFVSAATLKIDEKTILSPSDFNNTDQHFQIEVCEINENSKMNIEIFGAPGSALQVWIEGKKKFNLENGLVAYYPLNGNAIDESGNNHDGIVYGPLPVNDRLNNQNGSLHFDGLNDYVLLPSGETILGSNPDGWSVSCWALLDITTQDMVLISDSYSAGYDDFFGNVIAFAKANKQIYCAWRNSITGSHQSYDLYSGIACQSNTWYHIVTTSSKIDGYLRVYINGLKVQESLFNTDADYIDNTPIVIGTHGFMGSYVQFLAGNIDDVRIYNRSLSEDEIQHLFDLEY